MLLHVIILSHAKMSGSAALSAARKRRASSSTMAVGGGIAMGPPMSQSGSGAVNYYGGGSSSRQTLQGIMNQNPYSGTQQSSPFVFPTESAPNVPINIYENIELIKHQLSERTRLIQTQGSSIPVDKLRVLQKQNEIQTQILKQKIAIAQQMEITEKEQMTATAKRQGNNPPPVFNTNEPEFIYEKGIPRKNPKYRKPIEEQAQPLKSLHEPAPTQMYYPVPAAAPTTVSAPVQAQAPVQAPVQAQAATTTTASRKLSPFVCMMSDTGVIPPPVVILKSHDATLSEHHYIIQDMLEQLDYLHSTMKSERLSSVKEESDDFSTAAKSVNKETENRSDDGQSHAEQEDDTVAEGDEETELLMEVVMKDLTNSREFVEGIVDKIVNDTNLAEVIMKIEPIVKENQELRSLIHSQQQMMNEMNMMLFRLLNQQSTTSNTQLPTTNVDQHEPSVVYQDEGLNGDGLYQAELTEIILTPSGGQNNEEQIDDLPALSEAEAAVETPVEAAVEAPVEALVEAPVEAPVEAAVEAAVEAPVEAAVEAPVEAAVEAPVEAAVEAEATAQEIQSNDDSSDMPHFPEPISLVVSEL